MWLGMFEGRQDTRFLCDTCQSLYNNEGHYSPTKCNPMIEKVIKKEKILTAIQYDNTDETYDQIESVFGKDNRPELIKGHWVIGEPGGTVYVISKEEKERDYLPVNTNPIATIMEGFELSSLVSTMSIKNEAGETISFETTTTTEGVTNLIHRERRPKIGENEEE
jgi:hypothetical protein